MSVKSAKREQLYHWISLASLLCGVVLGAVVGLRMIADTIHTYVVAQEEHLIISNDVTVELPVLLLESRASTERVALGPSNSMSVTVASTNTTTPVESSVSTNTATPTETLTATKIPTNTASPTPTKTATLTEASLPTISELGHLLIQIVAQTSLSADDTDRISMLPVRNNDYSIVSTDGTPWLTKTSLLMTTSSTTPTVTNTPQPIATVILASTDTLGPADLPTTKAPTAIGTPSPTSTVTPAPTPTWTATATQTALPTPTPLLPIRIRIPSIDLNISVLTLEPEVTKEDGATTTWHWPLLDYEVAHYSFSGRPTEGKNIVLGGHNNYRGKVFRALPDLTPGDVITLSTLDDDHDYIVTETYIIPHRINPTAGDAQLWRHFRDNSQEQLTLFSCYPYASNADRIVVVARPPN